MLRAMLIVCLLSCGLPALAQPAATPGGAATPPLEEMAAGLRRQVEEMRALGAQIESAPERYREPLINRRDDRALKVLQGLGALVKEVAALPEDAPLRGEILHEMQGYLEGAGDQVLVRIAVLGDSIEEQKAAVESLQGTEKILAEARLNSLQSLRLRYYAALVDLIKGFQSLGLPQERLRQALLPLLQIHAEALVGGIRYSGFVLRELRVRQAVEQGNADLAAAVARVSRQQKLDLAHLETLIGLLEALGQSAPGYRAVLVQQGQGLSINVLQKGAIATLLEDTWASLKSSLVEDAPNLVFNILLFVAILLAFRSLARLARRAVRATCERPGVTMTTLLKDTLASITGSTVMLLGILVALAQVGISLGPMLAGLGVAGFIVGFALQDTLSNFAAGGMILIYRPYDVDDYVEVAGAAGFVKKMSLVSTTITTFDNQTLVVPNSKIWGDVIKNVTAQKVRRVDLMFGISYSDDIEQAERILAAVLEEHEKVLEKPEFKVKLHQLGDSSVNFAVRPWVRTEDYWDVYWDVTREVKLRFDREGITIPFPQRDVHLHRAEGGEA